jgi:hypothetical protein
VLEEARVHKEARKSLERAEKEKSTSPPVSAPRTSENKRFIHIPTRPVTKPPAPVDDLANLALIAPVSQRRLERKEEPPKPLRSELIKQSNFIVNQSINQALYGGP